MSAPLHRLVARYYEVRRILEVSCWSLPDGERLDVLLPSGILSAASALVPAPLPKERSGLPKDIDFGFTVHLLPPEPPPPVVAVRLALLGGGSFATDVPVLFLPEFHLSVRFRGRLNMISGAPEHAVAVTASIVGDGNALSIGQAVRLSGLVLDVVGSANSVRFEDGVEAGGHVSIRASGCRLSITASPEAERLDVRMRADGQTLTVAAQRDH